MLKIVLGAWCLVLSASLAVADVQFRKGRDAIEVLVDGKLFTRYIFTGGPRPYCYPLIGPTGAAVTRDYPMKAVAGETTDHPHHRSLWFTFGDVNGVDFWTETPKAGKIVHREFNKVVGGAALGCIRATNDWIGPDGKMVCEDTREIRFYRTTEGRLLDFDIRIRATEGPVTLGNTKEGMFGIRVADSMIVDKGKGHIVLSTGEKDAAAWGKKADWCDYYGPIDGKTVGIAVMRKPEKGVPPTYWHVRTYGLLAENAFGIRDYTGDKTRDASMTIPKDGSVAFRYRVYIHEGDTLAGKVADHYSAYLLSPKTAAK